MRLSDETLYDFADAIISTIKGQGLSYKEADIIDDIMEFLCDIKEVEELDAPSTSIARDYMFEELVIYNNSGKMKDFVEKVLSPKITSNPLRIFSRPLDIISVSNKTALVGKINPCFKRDGYKLIAVRRAENRAIGTVFDYRVLTEKEFVKYIPEIEKNTPTKNIKEEAEKRFAEKNYPATIDSCFTLVETVIKDRLDEMGIEYKESAQFVDIYPLLADALNLKPAGENIESYLQKILQGLKDQVNGLYHLANKAGNRHKLKYPPKRQDAKLAMNAAFTLCEYLSDTHKSRQAQ